MSSRTTTLKSLYGVLKTYELEIQQDDEIERSQRKEKTVALVAKDKEIKKAVSSEEEAVSEAPIRDAGEGKVEARKGKGKAEIEDESMHQDDLDDIDEYLAFLSRRFSKLKFKRNPSMSKTTPSYKKDSQQNKSVVDRSKFKCYNCGIAGHFSNECRKPKSREERKHASDGIDYNEKVL